jgi:L-ascorbate metabolism protein UlaG (beta-lactamase superfamily)
MSIRLRWLGNACFEVVLPSGKVLIIDPYIDYSPTSPIKSDQVTGADYIAVSHTHYDHCTDLGTLVKKFNSKVICGYLAGGRLADFFDFRWSNLVRVKPGDLVVFDDLKVEAKRSEHIFVPITKEQQLKATYIPPLDKIMPAMIQAGLHQIPVRDMEMFNYVFQTSDNLRIAIFGGDAYNYQRHEIIQYHPNVVIFQFGSLRGAESMVDLAALSGAELVIPYHHDRNPEETHKIAQAISNMLEDKSRAHLLDIEHGKWYQIGVKAAAIT